MNAKKLRHRHPAFRPLRLMLYSAEQFRRMTMIPNFTEQSANERTFLAWLRTGIAVIAFGFVVEKFNLFLVALASTAAAEVGREIRAERLSGPLGRYDGLALMLVGVILIVIGDLRFTRNKRLINDAEPQIMAGVRTEFIVTTVLVLLVAAYCASILVR
jgi:putative membrane protein